MIVLGGLRPAYTLAPASEAQHGHSQAQPRRSPPESTVMPATPAMQNVPTHPRFLILHRPTPHAAACAERVVQMIQRGQCQLRMGSISGMIVEATRSARVVLAWVLAGIFAVRITAVPVTLGVKAVAAAAAVVPATVPEPSPMFMGAAVWKVALPRGQGRIVLAAVSRWFPAAVQLRVTCLRSNRPQML